MKNNKISVLMSVYKKEEPQYFEIALDSILNQTLKPNEIVIVKDGPLTDKLEVLLNKYIKKEPIIKIVTLTENRGLGLALNEGIKHCSYQWVARMDSDDFALPDRLEKQMDYLQKHPNIDVLGSDIQEFANEVDEIVSYKNMPSHHKDIVKMLKRRNPICHMTVIFKKESVLEAGNYLDLPYVEDYYLWSRMIARGAQFASLNEPLVLVRIGNGMAERRGNKKTISSWKTVQTFLLDTKMISYLDYILNMILIRIFVYIPTNFKKILYKFILR